MAQRQRVRRAVRTPLRQLDEGEDRVLSNRVGRGVLHQTGRARAVPTDGNWGMSPIDGIQATVPATAGDRLPARATAGAPPRGIVALSCAGVSLTFPVFDEDGAWRFVLRGDPAGRRVQVLDDVTLSVPKGAFVGILGYNGAGKSTLLRVLAGVYHSTLGTVHRYGRMTGLF